jgi:hypothetical protein
MLHRCVDLCNQTLCATWRDFPVSFFVFSKDEGDLPILIKSNALVGVGKARGKDNKRGRLVAALPQHAGAQAVDAAPMVPVQSPNSETLQGDSKELTGLLATALGLSKKDTARVLREHHYILTLDFLLKLLYIHERRESVVPTILMVRK